MEAKEYIEKAHKICDKFEEECERCPLKERYCGFPHVEIDETVAFVENFDLSKVRKKKRCPHCGEVL